MLRESRRSADSAARRARLVAILLTAGAGAACLPAGDGPRVVEVRPGDPIRELLDTLRGPVRVSFAPGDYRLEPVPFVDPRCGNCQDPSETVPATRGLLVRGTGIELVGPSASQVALHTAAGYGVLFDGCSECRLAGITVTGGERDPDGRATDAGVVVRAGSVVIEACAVSDNLGDSATVHTVVTGIAGVAVREGGQAVVRGCRIERNSWDGIAAYRGAQLTAEDNVVDGVDAARGAEMGGGRGVGIGMTWDARGVVRGNLVTRYWKGIGAFVDARVVVEENVVERILTWGIAYWGPDGSRPVAQIRDNVVFETGACGVLVDRADADAEAPGELVGNVIVRTGTDARYDSGEPYCAQRPIARHAVPAAFRIEGNLVHDARQPGDLPTEPSVDVATLREIAAPLLARLAERPALSASLALGAFGGAGR